jgi:hypothetical protein
MWAKRCLCFGSGVLSIISELARAKPSLSIKAHQQGNCVAARLPFNPRVSSLVDASNYILSSFQGNYTYRTLSNCEHDIKRIPGAEF